MDLRCMTVLAVLIMRTWMLMDTVHALMDITEITVTRIMM
jgi:hypothetical protein